MKQYLLSIYQPDGDPPPPAVLEPIMRELGALQEEMKAAGVWVCRCGHQWPLAQAFCWACRAARPQ